MGKGAITASALRAGIELPADFWLVLHVQADAAGPLQS